MENVTHQSHDVIGQVPSQVRGHEAREASESHAGVVLVRTAQILKEKNGCKREKEVEKVKERKKKKGQDMHYMTKSM